MPRMTWREVENASRERHELPTSSALSAQRLGYFAVKK